MSVSVCVWTGVRVRMCVDVCACTMDPCVMVFPFVFTLQWSGILFPYLCVCVCVCTCACVFPLVPLQWPGLSTFLCLYIRVRYCNVCVCVYDRLSVYV